MGNSNITFDANGGTITPTSTIVTIGSTITLPTPTRSTLFMFNGWYTAASGGTKVGSSGSSYTVTGPTTLYAQWTRKSDGTIITPEIKE